MGDRFQFLFYIGIVENKFTQGLSIKLFFDDEMRAKTGCNFLKGWLAGFNDCSCCHIGVGNGDSQVMEKFGNCGFSRGDTAGDGYYKIGHG